MSAVARSATVGLWTNGPKRSADMADDTGWWWCLTHSRVEQGVASPAEERLGPYPSREAAQDWRDRHEHRSDSWDDADEAWDAWPGEQPGRSGGQTPA